MEILKFRILTSLFLVMVFLNNGYSQDATKVIAAFQESYAYENAANYLKSIEVLKSVYDENSYEINLRLGWLSYLNGFFTESVAFYNKAVSLMPYSIEPRFGIVYPMAAMGNWDQVIAQYKQILTTDPNNSVANFRMGVIYYNREDYTSANRHLEKVVNLYPFDLDGLVMLAWSKYRLQQYREAKILFQKALMHTPSNKSAQEGLSLIK